MQYGLAYKLSNLQLFIKESYTYDANGNRTEKITPFGTIYYVYDKENCLLSSGSKGQSFINYTYDKMGNLLSEESSAKSVLYSYNSQNRLIYCEVTDRSEKTYARTSYAYDAFGRRVLVQDSGEAALRTLYDGLTFDVIKQSPTFANGLFTDSNETGIRYGKTGRPTGERYRYIDDEDQKDGNRYFYLDDSSYKTVSARYNGSRTQFMLNGSVAAQTTNDYGTEYFSTDLLGSVVSVTDGSGFAKRTYSYDAFGSLIQGDLSGSSDFGYLSNQQDPTSHFYNYGYRDYNPKLARFTTKDPIRDGHNWFAYCNGDPVNFVDLLGLEAGDGKTKKTVVVIVRNTDGNGNKFDSTRYIYKDGTLVYADTVGANCSEKNYKNKIGETLPDGTYYLSNKGTAKTPLYQQKDGTTDSTSYKNVLSLRTKDPNLSKQQRDKINEGENLFHANQKKNKEIYGQNKIPHSAGCPIGQGGQEHHDQMMKVLMDGVNNPEDISVKIKSFEHTQEK